jgi:hypothetical protein
MRIPIILKHKEILLKPKSDRLLLLKVRGLDI